MLTKAAGDAEKAVMYLRGRVKSALNEKAILLAITNTFFKGIIYAIITENGAIYSDFNKADVRLPLETSEMD